MNAVEFRRANGTPRVDNHRLEDDTCVKKSRFCIHNGEICVRDKSRLCAVQNIRLLLDFHYDEITESKWSRSIMLCTHRIENDKDTSNT